MFTLEELRKLDNQKLTQALKEARNDLFKARLEVKNGQSKNTHFIKKHKKQTARIKTVIKEKVSK